MNQFNLTYYSRQLGTITLLSLVFSLPSYGATEPVTSIEAAPNTLITQTDLGPIAQWINIPLDRNPFRPLPPSALEKVEKTPTPAASIAEVNLTPTSSSTQRTAEITPLTGGNTTIESLQTAPLTAQTPIRTRPVIRETWSYISGGINVGLSGATTDSGRTELGDTSFILNGKIGLTPDISLRPAVLLGDRASFLVPATFDFTIPSPDPFEPSRFFPFVGGGLFITTEESTDSNFGPLISGGIDYQISDRVIANAGLNIGFLTGKTELGLMLGLGYRF